MLYVGLDIHDKRIAICVLGETGQIVRSAQVRTIDEMMRMLEALPGRMDVGPPRAKDSHFEVTGAGNVAPEDLHQPGSNPVVPIFLETRHFHLGERGQSRGKSS